MEQRNETLVFVPFSNPNETKNDTPINSIENTSIPVENIIFLPKISLYLFQNKQNLLTVLNMFSQIKLIKENDIEKYKHISFIFNCFFGQSTFNKIDKLFIKTYNIYEKKFDKYIPYNDEFPNGLDIINFFNFFHSMEIFDKYYPVYFTLSEFKESTNIVKNKKKLLLSYINNDEITLIKYILKGQFEEIQNINKNILIGLFNKIVMIFG